MEANTNAAHAGALAAEKRLPLHDPVRMDALIRRLEPRLSAVALGVTRDPDAARDVVQNAFVKVLRHGDKFRGQARVSTWLHRIVTNEALMWRRSQSRRREDPLDDHGERADGLASASPQPRRPRRVAPAGRAAARGARGTAARGARGAARLRARGPDLLRVRPTPRAAPGRGQEPRVPGAPPTRRRAGKAGKSTQSTDTSGGRRPLPADRARLRARAPGGPPCNAAASTT